MQSLCKAESATTFILNFFLTIVIMPVIRLHTLFFSSEYDFNVCEVMDDLGWFPSVCCMITYVWLQQICY